jgi:hypothetical protein
MLADQPVHVLNISVHTDEAYVDVCTRLAPELLNLRQRLTALWNSVELC